ncbi:MAG: glutamate--cysteine ligase [Halobacteriota archaeon]
MAAAFDRRGTVGVEEEFYVVDAESHEPRSTRDLLESPPADLGELDTELFEFVVETKIPVAEDVDGAFEAVRRRRQALVDHAAEHGFEVLSAGLHPTARWDEHVDLHVDEPRYRDQLDRIGYPQHRNLTAGLHVHVGVDDADEAVWIADEIRRYLPLFLALSANSPYWYGRDTRLASARAVVFENLPNTGMPGGFGDWKSYSALVDRMVEDDAVRDSGELWWDVRPHPGHGTVEVRSPDAQTDVRRVEAFVELVRALVLELGGRYEAGEDHRVQPWWTLDENRWRAARHGRDADFLWGDRGEVGVESLFDRLLYGLDVERADVLFDETGAERQRAAHADGGFDAVLDSVRVS